MSESDHQSFYEIQLNTSHLLLVFLGAAVVGVTVFYLGVVIGRGEATPTALAGDWDDAAPVEGAPADTDTQDKELGFYDDIKEEAGEPVASTEDPAGTSGVTSAQDAQEAGGEAGASAGEPAGGAAAQGADESADESADEPRTTEPSAGTPGSPAQAEVSLPQADPGLASGWLVQVRSTTERDQADGLTGALVADGYQAFVVSADIDGTTWYRVRVGRYQSRADAERVQARLEQRGDVEQTWVTES